MSETVEQSQSKGGNERLYWIMFIALAIIAIVVNIYFRTAILKFFGFYEPDGFYHYAVIRYAVNHGYVIPNGGASGNLSISGWPVHAAVTEPDGLYWVTLIPYFFLQYAGVSYYTIMRLIPILFGCLDAVGAYFLSRYLSKDRVFGAMVLGLVGLSMGDAARTTGGIYRGDTFAPIFLIVALILTIMMYKESNRNKKLLFTGLAGFALSLVNLTFSGGAFATITYLFAFAMLVGFGFVLDNKQFLDNGLYMLGALVVWFIIVNIYVALHFMYTQAFTGLEMIPIMAAMLIGLLVSKKLLSMNLLHTPLARGAVVIAYILVAIGAVYAIAPSFIYNSLVNSGFVGSTAFLSTIQELQPPSYSFFQASFGLTLYMTPMSIIMILSTLIPGYVFVFWGLAFISMGVYFFMHIYDSGKGMMSGNARLRFDVDAALLIIIAYFASTAYLQLSAIRFNSLLSVPLAIFAAYTIYWIGAFVKDVRLPSTDISIRFAVYVVLLVIFVYIAYIDTNYTANLYQADNLNPDFFSALMTFAATTPPNATVLTLWPDGSVVEGVANRTSVTDSVGAQIPAKAQAFAAWLYNSSDDPGFITGNLSGSPDYILVRNTWLLETGGILTEAELPINSSEASSQYSYTLFPTVTERVNSSGQFYQFQTQETANGGYSVVQLLVTNEQNGTQNVSAYILTQNGASPFEYVAFYNSNTGNYSIIHSPLNNTNGLMFLVGYSNIPSDRVAVNVTSAYLFAPGLYNSNMLKFLFFCDDYNCAWSNPQVQAKMVYMNPDTKIFKLSYSNTSG